MQNYICEMIDASNKKLIPKKVCMPLISRQLIKSPEEIESNSKHQKEINSEDVHIDECKESTVYEIMKVHATLENPKTQR